MAGTVLTTDVIDRRLKELDGWRAEDGAIRRRLVFGDFREAVSFLVLIAFEAEEADHHPDVSISYKKMDLALSTHSEGGVTDKDFALAAKIDAAFAKRAGAKQG